MRKVLHVALLFAILHKVSSSQSRCGDIKIEWGTKFKGGSSASCPSYLVTFGACKLLLSNSVNCSAAIYHLRYCVLLDRSSPDFRIVSRDPESQHIFVMKLIPEVDKCDNSSNENTIGLYSPRMELLSCMRNQDTQRSYKNVDTTKLPLVNIVISVSAGYMNALANEINFVVSHWRCYAKLHGYLVTLSVINSKNKNAFFVRKLEEIYEKYLPTAQWVLSLDVDTILVNMSRPFSYFLPQNKSLVLQMRETGELQSGVYFVRNDPTGYCFLRYWRSFCPPWYSNETVVKYREQEFDSTSDTISTINYENGALSGAMLHLVTAEDGLRCLIRDNNYLIYRWSYPECHCLHKFRKSVFHLKFQTNNPLLSFIDIYWPQEGLWRTQDPPLSGGRTVQFAFYNRFQRCFPSADFMIHGDKKIGTNFLIPSQSTNCTITRTNMYENGYNTKCNWLNKSEEYDYVHTHCLWTSPVCLRSQNDSTSISRFHVEKNSRVMINTCAAVHGNQLRSSCKAPYRYRDIMGFDVDIITELYNLTTNTNRKKGLK